MTLPVQTAASKARARQGWEATLWTQPPAPWLTPHLPSPQTTQLRYMPKQYSIPLWAHWQHEIVIIMQFECGICEADRERGRFKMGVGVSLQRRLEHSHSGVSLHSESSRGPYFKHGQGRHECRDE